MDLYELYSQVMDFTLKLRNYNSFDDDLYNKIFRQLKILFKEWETAEFIPKSAFVSCLLLLDMLASGSRFWSDEVCIKAEDAVIALHELIADIETGEISEFSRRYFEERNIN